MSLAVGLRKEVLSEEDDCISYGSLDLDVKIVGAKAVETCWAKSILIKPSGVSTLLKNQKMSLKIIQNVWDKELHKLLINR